MLPLPLESLPRLTVRDAAGPAEIRTPGADGTCDVLAIPGASNGLYVCGLALSPAAIDRALRLRFQVFNEELGEGLMTSMATGLDRDDFDGQMSHLILMERGSQRVVGTYRMQTGAQARAGAGYYSAGEYDLSGLAHLFPRAIECGRACIAREHRNFETLFLLWKGLSACVEATNTRYLFGCCSLTSTDPDEGWRALKTVRAQGAVHPSIRLKAHDACACGDPSREFAADLGPAIKLPKLFSAYVRIGTKVISEPALDREFGTVDFLILLDVHRISASVTVLDPLLRRVMGIRK